MKYIITIDQSTSATKAILFNDRCQLINRASVPHKQYYPKLGWVEHDAEEIYDNTIIALKSLMQSSKVEVNASISVAITNQRETVVVWNKTTGKAINHAVVWQCQRGADICAELNAQGHAPMIKEKTGLLIDPYFSASGVKWLVDNIDDARQLADKEELLMGTIDSWLIWKLTKGKVHATDHTNASRTMLFNIRTLDWDNNFAEDRNKCVCTHCGNFPKSFVKNDLELGTLGVLGRTLGKVNTFGAVKGKVTAGDFSFFRISTDDNFGIIKSYLGKGNITNDPYGMDGCIAVTEVENLQKLMKFICKNGFEHHVAMCRGNVVSILEEAIENYLGWDLYIHE